jgi:hypothetical protein
MSKHFVCSFFVLFFCLQQQDFLQFIHQILRLLVSAFLSSPSGLMVSSFSSSLVRPWTVQVEQQDQCKKAAERGRRRHPADPLSIFPLCTKCHPAAVGFLALRQLLLLLFFFFFFFLHRGAFALDKLAHNHLLPSFTFFPFLLGAVVWNLAGRDYCYVS